MYKILTEIYKDMMIFHVSGSILLPTAIQFQEEIIQIFSEKKMIEAVMDLSQVEKLDNSGLGVLINLSNKYNKQGRIISIYCPSLQVEQLIKDVGIEKFFSIYENEEELRNHTLSDAV
ncbi:MAG: STAS domain-containing protein [Desulfovibrionaceae bacterium]|nr:STAS domain-containing protein [Desulfovibrionaceae bacterium]